MTVSTELSAKHSTQPTKISLSTGGVKYSEPSVICNILALRQLPIQMYISTIGSLAHETCRAWVNLDGKSAILIHKAALSLLEPTNGRFGPPICQRPILVIVTAVLIKAMADFVTCNTSKPSKVEEVEIVWIVAVREKGWRL